MPITCNAVGDLLALVELAVRVADTLNEARKAPAECRALLDELQALQSLIELSRPMIEVSTEETLRSFVDKRLNDVAQRILDGLALIVDLDIALDPTHARPRTQQSLKHRIKRWTRMSKQSLRFALKTKGNARECREVIAQSFTSLIYALLVSFHGDHRRFSETVSAAHRKMTADSQRLAQTASASKQMLQENQAVFGAFFNKLLESLDDVQKHVSELDALVQLSSDMVRGNVESSTRATLDAIIRTHALATQDIIEAVTRDNTTIRQGLEVAMTHEHANTRRCIVQASNLEYIKAQEHVRDLLAQGFTETTTKTIGIIRSENDETRMQVVASVSGLSRMIANDMHEDRAHLARVEARLDELAGRVETIAGVMDLMRRVRLPSLQQLRLGWQLMMKCLESIPSAPVTLTSRDGITGALFISFTARQGHIRSAYAAIAIGFLVWRRVHGVMYQVPTTHMIYVLDFFDSRITIPLEEVTSPEAMHKALVRRANKMGLVLIHYRHYEIRLASSAEPLPSTWNEALTPGGEVLLNARVFNSTNEAQAICPTCSARINYSETCSRELAWISCPYCPMQVLVSTLDEPGMSLSSASRDMNSLQDASDADDTNATPDSPPSHLPSLEPAFSLKSVLKQCKRVHFITQRLPEHAQMQDVPEQNPNPTIAPDPLSKNMPTSRHPQESPVSIPSKEDRQPISFDAFLFPAIGAPRMFQLCTIPETYTDPNTGRTSSIRRPHPSIYASISHNEGWMTQPWQSLFGMTTTLPNPFVVYYPQRQRSGEPLLVNKSIEEIQGTNFRLTRAWKGDIIVAKYKSLENKEIIDMTASDYIYVKNWFAFFYPVEPQT